MKFRSWMAGAVSLALLAGCSGAADPDDLTYQAMGVRQDSQLVTVNGEDITAGQYMFSLLNSVEQWGLTLEDDWKEVIGEEDPITVADFVKKDALDAAKLHVIIKQKAEELGCTISEEDQNKFEEAYTAYVDGMGGQEKFQEWMTTYCTNEADFREFNMAVLYNNGVITKLVETGALEPTEEDLDTYIQNKEFYAAKHILISTRHMNDDGSYEEFTQDERNAALEEAKALQAQILAADDVNAEFDRVMNERSDDGRDPEGKLYSPEGYQLVQPGRMVSPFEEGTLALAEGEVSEPVQSVFGYHIIMRLPVDREQAREAFVQENYKYNLLLTQWLEEAEVTTTKAYDQLDVHGVYESWTQVRDARAAAQATPAPSQEPAPAETQNSEN